MTDHRFGVSSRLFSGERLSREHLVHIAAHGFETFELFAIQGHFDFHSSPAVAELGEWLGDTRLALHAVHAPDTASAGDLDALLAVARQLPFPFLNLHVNGASARSLEALAERAAGAGVRLALEVRNEPRSQTAALVHLIEEEIEESDIGLCFDFGHAHLAGDVGDAIETSSGHLFTTHVHDNGGRRDDHLVPYEGSIQWEAAVMETQKIGYDGVLMFEPAAAADPVAVLQRCARARQRIEAAFITF
jgi:sugar phosphate isomerase/epimerase